MFSRLCFYKTLAAAAILAAAPCTAADDTLQPLPAEGAVTEHLVSNAVRLRTEAETVTISGLCVDDYSPIDKVTAEIQTGSMHSPVRVTDWQWKNSTATVDWYVLIDVSDSMRKPLGSRNFLRESLAAALQLLNELPAGETLRVMSTAENMKELGAATDADSAAALRTVLQQQQQTAAQRNLPGNARTAYLQHIAGLVRQIPRPAEGHAAAVILFSDGDDDGSSNISPVFSELVTTATQKGIHINCVGFQRTNRGTGINNLDELSSKTDGQMILCAGEALHPEMMKTLAAKEHRPGGSFKMPRPREAYDALNILCYKNALTTPCAKLTLQSSILPPVPPPAPAEEPARNAGELVNTVANHLTAALNAMAEQARTDRPAQATPTPEQLQATVTEHAAAAVAPVQALKQLPIADVEQAVNQVKEREGTSEPLKNALNKLVELCRDTQIQTVTESHIRSLLEQQAPPAESAPQEPAPQEPAVQETHPLQDLRIIFSGLILVLLCLIAVLILKMRSKETEKQEAKTEPETASAEPCLTETRQSPVSEPEPPTERKTAALPAAAAHPAAGLLNTATGAMLLLEKEIVRIGRARDNDISISNEPSVSSYHCTVKQQRNGRWLISDLGSSNGVYVNDRKTEQTELAENDLIELGRIKLRFKTNL